ncbi:MAG: MaoC/PaaZ C-terminal domain-containing protein [Anaerolineaceae bacterium]|jgi:acyl dehydratase
MSPLSFEDIQIGQTYTSEAITIREADVKSFATLTGDTNPIHLDAEYAATQVFGQRVAHGLLGLSITVGLAWKAISTEGALLALREIDNWKFSAPIYLDDSIRVRATVRDKKAVRRLGGGLVTYAVEIVNQDGQVVQHGDWVLLVTSQG